MPSSRAEVQKRYRERKKERGEDFLEKERARQKKNYMPVYILNEKQKNERRQAIRERVKKCREAKKAKITARRDDFPSDDVSDDILETPIPNPRMIVSLFDNMPKKQKVKTMMKKQKCEKIPKLTFRNRTAEKTIYTLKRKNISIKRKLKTLQKQITRSNSKVDPSTPRSKTDHFLREAGVHGEMMKTLRKKLLFGNVVLHQLKTKAKTSEKLIYGAVAGKIVEKYRCKGILSEELGINRNRVVG